MLDQEFYCSLNVLNVGNIKSNLHKKALNTSMNINTWFFQRLLGPSYKKRKENPNHVSKNHQPLGQLFVLTDIDKGPSLWEKKKNPVKMKVLTGVLSICRNDLSNQFQLLEW